MIQTLEKDNEDLTTRLEFSVEGKQQSDKYIQSLSENVNRQTEAFGELLAQKEIEIGRLTIQLEEKNKTERTGVKTENQNFANLV